MESRTQCHQCKETFLSRTQLFKHLRQSDCGGSEDKQIQQLESVVLLISYIGTHFEGVQKCVGVPNTVEEILCRALNEVCGIQVSKASNVKSHDMSFLHSVHTPRGVHATTNILTTKLPKLTDPDKRKNSTGAPSSGDTVDKDQTLYNWLSAVNVKLSGKNLKLLDRAVMIDGFHPEKWCESRRYEYLIPYQSLANLELDGELRNSGEPTPCRRTGRANPFETEWHRSIQRRVKAVCKHWGGVFPLHNYSRVPGEELPTNRQDLLQQVEDSWRRIHRVHCTQTLRLLGQEWLVLSVSVRSASAVEVLGVVGMTVAVVRGHLPQQALLNSLRQDLNMPVPQAPPHLLYLAQLTFTKFISKHHKTSGSRSLDAQLSEVRQLVPLQAHLGPQPEAKLTLPGGGCLHEYRDHIRQCCVTLEEDHKYFNTWIKPLQGVGAEATSVGASEAAEAEGESSSPEGGGGASSSSGAQVAARLHDAAAAAAAAAGGDKQGLELLVTRGMNRTQDLFHWELSSLAALAEVPPQGLSALTSTGTATNLWLLQPPPRPSSSSSCSWHSRLVSCLGLLSGVRRHLKVLAWGTSQVDLVKVTAALNLTFPSWSLTHDLLFPPASALHLPFLPISRPTSLAIRLSQVISGRYVDESECPEARVVVMDLGEDCLVLGTELLLPPSPPAALPSCSSGPAAAAAAALLPLCSPHTEACCSLSRLRALWSSRPFSFNASLDLSVALAALNITASMHRHHLRARDESSHPAAAHPLSGLSFLDPCCGSGTLPALAQILGAARVWGSDLRRDFLTKTQDNFRYMAVPYTEGILEGELEGKQGSEEARPMALEEQQGHNTKAGITEPACNATIQLFNHDAKLPFPSFLGEPQDVHTGIDVVVGNPPWGKNIGTGEDTYDMTHNLVNCFPLSTIGLLVSEWTFRALFDMHRRQLSEGRDPNVDIVNHVKCGSSVLVILRKWIAI